MSVIPPHATARGHRADVPADDAGHDRAAAAQDSSARSPPPSARRAECEIRARLSCRRSTTTPGAHAVGDVAGDRWSVPRTCCATSEPSMGAEDFFVHAAGEARRVRAARAGGADDGSFLHSSRHDFNDSVIPLGAGLLASLAERAMPDQRADRRNVRHPGGVRRRLRQAAKSSWMPPRLGRCRSSSTCVRRREVSGEALASGRRRARRSERPHDAVADVRRCTASKDSAVRAARLRCDVRRHGPCDARRRSGVAVALYATPSTRTAFRTCGASARTTSSVESQLSRLQPAPRANDGYASVHAVVVRRNGRRPAPTRRRWPPAPRRYGLGGLQTIITSGAEQSFPMGVFYARARAGVEQHAAAWRAATPAAHRRALGWIDFPHRPRSVGALARKSIPAPTTPRRSPRQGVVWQRRHDRSTMGRRRPPC